MNIKRYLEFSCPDRMKQCFWCDTFDLKPNIYCGSTPENGQKLDISMKAFSQSDTT